jgi:hypothetical protein
MRRLVPILAIALLAAVRFCHLDVLWVEEAYPLAAARYARRQGAVSRYLV